LSQAAHDHSATMWSSLAETIRVAEREVSAVDHREFEAERGGQLGRARFAIRRGGP
jgi:hypothetical protein